MLISLGSNCYVSWTLRKVGTQDRSYPIDWVNSFRFSRLVRFIDAFEPALIDGLTPSELSVDKDKPNIYALEEYKVRLPHEHDVKPDITRPEIAARFGRRFDRLKEDCHAAPYVVFVRAVAGPYSGLVAEPAEEYRPEILEAADRMLRSLCGHDRFTLLLCHGTVGYFDAISDPAGHPRVMTAHLGLPFENGFFPFAKDLPQKQAAFDIQRVAFAPMAAATASAEVATSLEHPIFRGRLPG